MKVNNITHKRCFFHQEREAVARCPECLRFYCRECITEHDDRVICASCLKNQVKQSLLERYHFGWFYPVIRSASGIALLWIIFYFVGQLLLMLPVSFHDGTIWLKSWWDF